MVVGSRHSRHGHHCTPHDKCLYRQSEGIEKVAYVVIQVTVLARGDCIVVRASRCAMTRIAERVRVSDNQ
jgi:hypothetical protein